jgi:Kef-type K+ transport system membrane component KefB
MSFITMAWEWLHSQPSLARFAIGMAVIVGIPPLSRRARLPAVVGLLLSGVVLGPHVLGLFGEHAPVADFFAELGKLLLMFFAGLEIDIAQFRRERNKSIKFGLVTTLTPLLLLGSCSAISPLRRSS